MIEEKGGGLYNINKNHRQERPIKIAYIKVMLPIFCEHSLFRCSANYQKNLPCRAADQPQQLAACGLYLTV